MAIECPSHYSVWENDKGVKIFVEDVFVDDEPFFVTVIRYPDRNEMGAVGEELDNEQWAELIHDDGFGRLASSRPRLVDPMRLIAFDSPF